MRKVFVLTLLVVIASTLCVAGDDDNGAVVRWATMTGVIINPGGTNLVAGIQNGGQPWTTTGGSARVNLITGDVRFSVTGLVLNGGNSSGTRDGVAQVKGTLVCNPGAANQAIIDTPLVDLSLTGDASFRGNVGSIGTCANQLFLVRIAAGRWIATGAVRSQDNDDGK
jgi:hypothetical protein